MNEPATDHLATLLPPLLRSLEMLGFIARHFHPPDFGTVMEAAGAPDRDLRTARAALQSGWEKLTGGHGQLLAAPDATLAAFEGLRKAPAEPDGVRAAY